VEDGAPLGNYGPPEMKERRAVGMGVCSWRVLKIGTNDREAMQQTVVYNELEIQLRLRHQGPFGGPLYKRNKREDAIRERYVLFGLPVPASH